MTPATRRRGEHVGIVDPARDQPLHHVEAVSPVGDRQRREERGRGRGQEAPGHGLLFGLDTRANVRHELPDPMHR
jgi:hypothetical protein